MKSKFLITALVLSVLSSAFIFTQPLNAADDDHYLNSEHYFITKEKLTQGWIYVILAAMKTPATAQTKSEAEFMTIRDGEDIWTKYYYTTRIARKEELKKGLEIIACEIGDDDQYRSPESRDEAIQNNWFMAKITDLSDTYKGFVTVSGGYKIRLNNIRIAEKKK